MATVAMVAMAVVMVVMAEVGAMKAAMVVDLLQSGY